MALRTIRIAGDPVLAKKCREVKEMTPRIAELIADMFETMYEAYGVGLAAPQVGILKQIVVIDCSLPEEDDEETAEEAAGGSKDPDNAEEEAEETEAIEDTEEEEAPSYGGPYVLINPVITLREGEQTGDEGCLSLPGKIAQVKRPEHVIVEALDETMEPFTLEAHGLLARAICHECDHLEGHMYTEFAEEGTLRDLSTEDD